MILKGLLSFKNDDGPTINDRGAEAVSCARDDKAAKMATAATARRRRPIQLCIFMVYWREN
jgi:hypothetical protein